MSKTITFFTIFTLFFLVSKAQMGWDEPISNYNQLPDSDDIIECLKIGMPLILAGIFIIFLSKKGFFEESYLMRYIGIIGIPLIIAGIIYLYPIFLWIRFLFLYAVILVVIIAGIVIGYQYINNKK